LWNELAVRMSFTLLCGYSAVHFASDETRETLATICRMHTHVHPVGAARRTSRSSPSTETTRSTAALGSVAPISPTY
jgi:hypothetical protein